MPQYMANWPKTENCFPERSKFCNTKCYDELGLANRSSKMSNLCERKQFFCQLEIVFLVIWCRNLQKRTRPIFPNISLGLNQSGLGKVFRDTDLHVKTLMGTSTTDHTSYGWRNIPPWYGIYIGIEWSHPIWKCSQNLAFAWSATFKLFQAIDQ